MNVLAWIGLGANLGNPAATVREALKALAELEGARLIVCSSLYRTAPVGPGVTGQPDYINAVAAIETALPARDLLQALSAVEIRFGRLREARNAARTLDLDLLLYGDRVINLPDLQVPHPRMHQRAFVLVPLAEVGPHTTIPGFGEAAGLAAALAAQDVQRLPD